VQDFHIRVHRPPWVKTEAQAPQQPYWPAAPRLEPHAVGASSHVTAVNHEIATKRTGPRHPK
jgi:hypothetical protein